jgi:hypothetical protein
MESLPEEIIHIFFDKLDTTNFLKFSNTSKKIKNYSSNYLEFKKINLIKTDIFIIEINFTLENAPHNIVRKIRDNRYKLSQYIKVVNVNFYRSYDNVEHISYNFITPNVEDTKKKFIKYLKDYELYDILIKNLKEAEVYTYVTKKQDAMIMKYKKENKKFMFDTNSTELFDNSYKIINENITKTFKLDLLWLNMQTSLDRKNFCMNNILIRINIDRTLSFINPTI